MKKRLLTVLLAVCLVVALGTVTAAAADDDEGTPVARIGDTTYTSLYNAMWSLGANEKLVLLTNCNTSYFKLSNNSTIDLNGHNLTYTGTSMSIPSNSGQEASIIDSSVSGSKRGGTLIINGERDVAKSVFEVRYFTLNVSNINIESTGCVFYPHHKGATINITNCDINTSGAYCVATNATSQEYYGVTINIKGSNLSSNSDSGNDCAVMINGDSTLNIYDSVITGNRQGVFARAGDVNIVNSKIAVTGAWAEQSGNDADKYYDSDWQSGNEAPSAAIVIGNRNGTYFADANVTIENSQISSNNNDLSAIYVDATTKPQGESGVNYKSNVSITGSDTVVTGSVTSKAADGKTIEIEVTGGSFTDDSVDNYVPDGMELNGEGNVVVSSDAVAVVDGIGYTDLAKAIAAADDGDTVTLVKDLNDTISIAAGKSIVLDLAGKTLTSPSDSMVYGELTIEDSSNSTGTFVSDKSVSVDGGILTLESGTINIENDYGIYCLNDGTAIVNGGKIESLYAPLTGNNTTGDMNFTVNGGELTAQYGPAIYMPGQGELTITDGVLNGGISLRMGQVNISGGTIYATNGSIDSPSEFYNYSGNAWLPDALYVFNGTYDSENDKKGNSLNINITGGEFICENGQGSAVAIYDLGKVDQNSEVKISDDATLVTNASNRGAYQVLSLADIGVNTPAAGYGNNENVDKVETAISGGNFSSAVDKEYLASGINAQLYSINNSNAPYSYYSTVEDAMQVAKPGDVVVNLSAVTSETMYEVKFDNNGTVATISVPDGANLTLPAPTRNGYTFGGWRYGNTVYKAGETVKVTSDMTFTAIWNAINIPDTYDIEIADAANGEVDTSLSNASAGSTITITATPDSGYSVASVTVTGPDGRVDVVRVNATTYTFKMPAGDVTVRVTFTDSDALPFTDVGAGQWFYDAVAYVYTNGMMEGDSATTFNPDGTMTRAMFWAVLGRIDGATITGTNWAEQARDWAMAEGVSDGTDPNGLVTREQMVTMLWRYAVAKGYDVSIGESTNILSYADFGQISEYAIPAMQWGCGSGVITGVTESTLEPAGTATRAQCAAIFMRFDQM